MGEIAEMMLDGTMDYETGEWNFDGEDGPGFPMTGAEAAEYLGYRRAPSTASSKPRYKVSKSEKKLIAAIGEIRQCDQWHFQIRKDGKVLADWWPHKRKWRVAGQSPVTGDTKAMLAAIPKTTGVA